MTGDAALARLASALIIPPFPGHQAPGWVLRALADYGLAGVTLFGPNIADPAQLAGLIAAVRSVTDEPVIAIDEEGGDVTRISHRTGSRYPGNAALGAVDDPAMTGEVYCALGADLAALGVNLDLAPSVDVNTAAGNPVIGTRSFGSDTALVARHGAAAVKGLQSAGVAACAKHFPGHGSTHHDSHHVVAALDGSLDVVMRRDLPPFVAAIAAGVRAVMPGHLLVPGLTGDLPASLSAAAQAGLLRGQLGFTGLIVSDALEMRAVSGPYGIPEAAVRAVEAGTDLLCFGRDQDEPTYLAVRDALAGAVRSGRLPVARLEESAERVADLRTWQRAARALAGLPGGSPNGPPGKCAGTPPDTSLTVRAGGRPDLAADSPVGMEAARRAVRLDGTVPALTGAVLVEIVPPSNIAVGTVPWGLSTWIPADQVYRISTGAADDGTVAGPPPAGPAAAATASAAGVLEAAAGRPLLIVVRDAHRYKIARNVVIDLLSARPDAVLVEMGLPAWRPPAGVYLVTYGATRASSRVAAERLGLIQEVSDCGPDRP